MHKISTRVDSLSGKQPSFLHFKTGPYLYYVIINISCIFAPKSTKTLILSHLNMYM